MNVTYNQVMSLKPRSREAFLVWVNKYNRRMYAKVLECRRVTAKEIELNVKEHELKQ